MLLRSWDARTASSVDFDCAVSAMPSIAKCLSAPCPSTPCRCRSTQSQCRSTRPRLLPHRLGAGAVRARWRCRCKLVARSRNKVAERKRCCERAWQRTTSGRREDWKAPKSLRKSSNTHGQLTHPKNNGRLETRHLDADRCACKTFSSCRKGNTWATPFMRQCGEALKLPTLHGGAQGKPDRGADECKAMPCAPRFRRPSHTNSTKRPWADAPTMSCMRCQSHDNNGSNGSDTCSRSASHTRLTCTFPPCVVAAVMSSI